jgi:hypothetical protein
MTVIVPLLVAIVLLAQPYIGLDVHLPLPGWDLDAPLADLAALGLVALLPFLGRPRPPAPAAWGAFLAVGLAAALLADPAETLQGTGSSVHQWLRKPVFSYVAYAVALPVALTWVEGSRIRRLLLLSLGAAALVSLVASSGRVASGLALWWQGIEGLTNNHKTLAVWMAPFGPWLWSQRHHRGAQLVSALVAIALLLSLSKTAWLAAAFGLAWVVHYDGRPIVARWWLVLPALAVAFAALSWLPELLGSKAMMDAARSRDSLDLRAWTMFSADPILGHGPGSAVTWEMHEFPHYRINHVEAHGVVQKVASETGMLGLIAWLAATILTARSLWSGRSETTSEEWAWIGVFAALHVNLLASTEAFTMTHWVPLGLAWFFARGNR